MNILITGGAGYIGTALVQNLINRQEVDSITIYDNLDRVNYNLFLGNDLSKTSKLRFVQGDILDSRGLKKALLGVDVVYHLAAKVTTPFANADPHFYEQVNHWGTAELAYSIEDSEVKKVIYTSSIGIYGGSRGDQLLDEKVVPNPRTFYGISKYKGEDHINRLSDKMETYVLRCGNVYGYNPSMRFDAVINRFAFESNYYKRISINGNGKQKRPFIHIDLLSRTLADIITNEVPSGTYNLVGQNLEVLDVVDAFKELIPELEFIFINQDLNMRGIQVDTNLKLSEFIDIKTDTTFKEDIEEFLARFSF